MKPPAPPGPVFSAPILWSQTQHLSVSLTTWFKIFSNLEIM
eukprot:CAMPEP_0182602638 /NCGR_PEP_ID=MMETSP1324-20130603/92091_1 /TAXON_ID=236786 /ORGANISM="Florenciella sp., Strain RCC1587" /LENGTH=40 /DNA_ID= /DNA_START= /DNA_END= /DNA_ORIENTATION=